MNEHLSSKFEQELDFIRSAYLRMGGLVESMITDAVTALSNGNEELIERVLQHEEEVNDMEVEIDQHITSLFARFQPAASDLRLLIAISKTLTDLERSGDEAEKIAKVARRLHEQMSFGEPQVELKHIADAVISMLRRSLDAFANADMKLAAEVVRSDKAVDKAWKGILRELISYMMEDPRTISPSIDLLFVARSLERIGDHCTNMSERVIYVVQGADVRHMKAKKVEKFVNKKLGVETKEADKESEATPEAEAAQTEATQA